MGKKPPQITGVYSSAGVDPHHFFAHKNGRIRDGPLEDSMSSMVPTKNSGRPKKKNTWIHNSWLLLCNPGGYHPKLAIKTRHYV